jgi:multidrug resistance efflux pump
VPEVEAPPATAAATTETTVVNGPDGKPLDPVRAAAAIERLRTLPDVVKTKDTEIADLQAKLKAHEDEKLSDTEKLTNRVAELEAEKIAWEHERQDVRIGSAVREAASKAGAKYPDAVYKLIDLASVEYDKDGAPRNLDKVVEAIAKSYPEMFNGTSPGRVAAGPRTPAAGRDFNQLIRESAGRG